MYRVANAHGWAKGTVAEAVHGLEMNAAVCGGVSESDAEYVLGVRCQ
jgi:hypothetical protein